MIVGGRVGGWAAFFRGMMAAPRNCMKREATTAANVKKMNALKMRG